ncbi:MAG: hypothetical protein ACRDHL_09360 [Candidatus Promineifilaceae bacterium]
MARAFLALLALLLVSLAAVAFLAQRNQALESAQPAVTAEPGLAATRDQLEADLAVRDAAYQSAEATRRALAAKVDALETEATRQNERLVAAEATASAAGLRAYIFSPRDGSLVSVNQLVTILIGAWADAGVERVELSFNGGQPESFAAQGEQLFTLRQDWSPPLAGDYQIRAVAFDVEGNSSPAATVTLSAGP